MIDADKTTLRHYLMLKEIKRGTRWRVAREAVATTAIEHPEWDMTEERTWDEWEEAFQ